MTAALIALLAILFVGGVARAVKMYRFAHKAVRVRALRLRIGPTLAACASLFVISGAFAAADPVDTSPSEKAGALDFGGTRYLHRWSKNGQNEFTPDRDKDLERWHDMITLNVHQTVHDGGQLASLANSVLGNYQAHGKIVRTDSKPRTPQRAAEHLIVAVLGNGSLLETAFARVVLVDGVGVVVVYSHRIYGKDAGEPMGAWLQNSGPSVEKTLMSWQPIPSPDALKRLPQSQ